MAKISLKNLWCRISVIVAILAAATLAGFLIWIFAFNEPEPDPIASCDGCHCIKSGNITTCPTRPKTDYDDGTIDVLASQVPINPYTLDCNPYKDDGCETNPPQIYTELGTDAVCGLHYTNGNSNNNGTSSSSGTCSQYKLVTYPSWTDAESSGAFVTHIGSCGVCSTTQDLAAYLRTPDLTTSASSCSKRALLNRKKGRKCLNDLGMTDECAEMWIYNALQNADECFSPCFESDITNERNNGPSPECKLNDCLQCDEDKSGPVFKMVAGRTRRSSGVLSAIARPCEGFPDITHESCPETKSV